MARPRKGDKSVEDSSPTRPTNPIRTSLPRASKLNKPNYKIDLDEEDDALMAFGTPGSSRTRQKKHQSNKYLDMNEGEVRSIRKRDNNRGKEASEESARMRRLGCRLGYKELNEAPYDQNPTREAANVASRRIGTIFSWLMDMKVVNEYDRVQLVDFARRRLIGSAMLVREGILCNCCQKVFTVQEFGAHRGDASITCRNVFLTLRNTSLLTCQSEAWNKLRATPSYGSYTEIKSEQGSSDRSDDSCIICADGGNLICCSTCPSTYHQSCLNLEDTPPDDWKCHYCRCKYCEYAGHEKKSIYTCLQCEKSYHSECFGGDDIMSFDLNVCSAYFCGSTCSKIYFKLEEMLGVKKHIDQDLSWTLWKRKDKESVSNTLDSNNLLTSNLKIAVSAQLMEDCFEPIVDRYTKINMIRSVAFSCGSNFPRINFTRFYTAILESKDEIVTVASIRIHGSKLAEMPFIATSQKWRHKGMCRTMLIAIESALRDTGVEYLYIPSASAMVRKWITSFGFEDMSEEVRKEINTTNSLMFLTSTRLQKDIRGLNFLPDLNL